jgi:hypothetical protein
VLSHGKGSWDGSDFVVITPFKKVYELNKENIYGGVASDVFFVGLVNIPYNDSVFLKRSAGESNENFRSRVNIEIKRLGYPVTEGGLLSDSNVDVDPFLDPVWHKFCEEHKCPIRNHFFTDFGIVSLNPITHGMAPFYNRKKPAFDQAKKIIIDFFKARKISVQGINREQLRQLIDSEDMRLLTMHLQIFSLEHSHSETYDKYKDYLFEWLDYWEKKAKQGKIMFNGETAGYDKEDMLELLPNFLLDENSDKKAA